jgi:agmatinase
MTRIHEPPDALAAPRFTGPRTFARLPNLATLEDVDCAVYGMPWDGGTTFRSGARFGPEAIRSASGMIRTYNPAQQVQVFGALSAVDYGDAPTAPGYIEDTLRRIEEYVAPIAAAGVVPFGMGGDHSVTLAELRALASVHGPLGLVQLDSHTDLWDTYNGFPYSHGTVVRRAIEAGILDASRVIGAGMRGSLYGEDDVALPGALGVEAIPWAELAELTPDAFAARVRQRVGTGPVFCTLDVDFVDRLLSGHGDTRGGRPHQPRGAELPALPARGRVRRLRRRRGGAHLRRGRPGHGAVRCQRSLRDALPGRRAPLEVICFWWDELAR